MRIGEIMSIHSIGSEVLKNAQAGLSKEVELLLRVAQEHDWQAFEQLYHLYYRRLTRFLDKVVRQPSLVEEILDDTMLVVWQKADSFNQSSRVSTWIFSIAYRKALKALERERRHAGEESPGGDSHDAEHVEASPDTEPEAQLIQHQSRQLVNELLAMLPVEHRAVIELTYYHGHPYGEIALIVGCPVATVKTRMFYARRKMRELLMRQGWMGM